MKRILYWPTLIAAFGMGLYSLLPDKQQPGQVNIPLYLVIEQQRELIDRGHDIKDDGKFGPETDLALTMELTK